MNTFGSDLSKILSARERAQSTDITPVDVPIVKADTIKKAELAQPEKEPVQLETEPAQSETEPVQLETEPAQPEK